MFIIGLGWYLIGCVGFVYWWTKNNDLKVDGVIVMLVVGIIGLFAWVVGYLIHGKPNNILIMKKRRR